MAWIKADIGGLHAAADTIEQHIRLQRHRMQQTAFALSELGGSWSGADYQQTMIQWDQVSNHYSASGKMLRELEDQVINIRRAATEYDKARKRALSRAKRLR
jgi:hypothetical protein